MIRISLIQNNKNGKYFYELQISNQKAFIQYHMFSYDLMLLISIGFTKKIIEC